MFERFRDWLVPQERKGAVPHSLQRKAMSLMAVLIVFTFVATSAQSALWSTSQWLVSTVLPAVIVDLTNAERGYSTLRPLTRSSVLDAAATLKAQHMAENEYFSHYSPSGVSPWYWFGIADYNFVHAGENLAIHFTDSGEVVEAWMNSPTHRDNILNGNYTEIGVGTAKGTYQGYETVYVVQLFGTPAASPAVAAATSPEPEPEPAPASIAQGESQDDPEAVADENASDPASGTIAANEEDEPVAAESVAISSSEERFSEEVVVEVVEMPAEENTTEIADMRSDETGFTLYSDHMSTSTGGIPATISGGGTPQETSGTTPSILTWATQPQQVLSIMYTFMATFVVFLLLVSILVEVRRQQPIQIAYSTALLLIMAVLWTVHSQLTTGAVVI